MLVSVDIAMGKKPAPGAATVSSNAYLNVGVGSQILRDIGVEKIRLMGAPIKYNAISGFDFKVHLCIVQTVLFIDVRTL